MRILLVEDNPGDARLIRELLETAGGERCELTHAERLDQALRLCQERPFDVMLLDLSLPDSLGLDTVTRAAATAGQMPIIVLTALDDEATGVEALRRGAQDYLIKGRTGPPIPSGGDWEPSDADRLIRAIRYAVERQRLGQELRQARDELERRVAQRTADLNKTVDMLRAEALARAHAEEERRRLENEVLDISVREQRRIGQDLHDTLGQQLTGISFMVTLLQQSLARRSLPEADDAGRAAELVRGTISLVHGLARGLCPIGHHEEGLMPALQDLAVTVRQTFKVSCVFRCEQPVAISDLATATHLYYIVQEAVNNALRHGKADRIAINLAPQNGGFALSVTDNGVGLPDPAHQRGGLGLRIMRYRSAMIGGALDVKPHPQGGTVVTCLRAEAPAQPAPFTPPPAATPPAARHGSRA